MKKQMIPKNSPTSGQDAALALIPIEGRYSTQDALRVSVIVLYCLMSETLSPEVLAIAKWKVSKRRPSNIAEEDYKRLVEAIFGAAENIRKGNPMSGMF